MKVKVVQTKGQIVFVEIRTTKDPGVPATEGNDIGIITGVAGTIIATQTRKKGTLEVIARIVTTIADTMITGGINLLTGAIAKSEETTHPII